MRVDFMLLANDVRRGPNNTIDIFGVGSNSLTVNGLPATLPMICVVIRFALSEGDYDTRHDVRLELWYPDGQLPLDGDTGGEILIAQPGRSGPVETPSHQIFRVRNVPFPIPGPYEFRALLDNEPCASLAMEVRTP